jgi:hypothetical protein
VRKDPRETSGGGGVRALCVPSSQSVPTEPSQRTSPPTILSQSPDPTGEAPRGRLGNPPVRALLKLSSSQSVSQSVKSYRTSRRHMPCAMRIILDFTPALPQPFSRTDYGLCNPVSSDSRVLVAVVRMIRYLWRFVGPRLQGAWRYWGNWGFFCSAPQQGFVVLVLGVFCARFPPRGG